jgi:hypothetical protein
MLVAQATGTRAEVREQTMKWEEQAMLRAWMLVLGVVIPLGSAHADELVDLTKVNRVIAKEPKYKNQPRYALLVFGPKADGRAWLVMDGEDVLYIDRNGNGDLTEEGKRVVVDAEATGQLRLLSYIPERSKQHGRRFPFASMSQAVLIRRARVSACLAETIQ